MHKARSNATQRPRRNQVEMPFVLLKRLMVDKQFKEVNFQTDISMKTDCAGRTDTGKSRPMSY